MMNTCVIDRGSASIAPGRVKVKKRKSQEKHYDNGNQMKRNKKDNSMDFQSSKVTIEEWWDCISRDVPDKQYAESFLQLQCLSIHKENSFLLIDNSGEVVSTGSQSDPNTFLDIINWFPHGNKSECQIVGHRSGDTKPLILYMDGDQLRTKDYYRENNQIYARLDRSTIFHFLSRDGKELVNLPFMIQSDNKIPIDFDKSGRFRSSSNMSNRTTSSYRPCIFYPHRAINLRETSL